MGEMKMQKKGKGFLGKIGYIIVILIVGLALTTTVGCGHKKQIILKPDKTGKAYSNSVGMKFVLIRKGTFAMGSLFREKGRNIDEKHHRVTIEDSFYLQATEVTQGQWKKVMGDKNNPSYFKDCDDCPVEQVSWNDAQEFITKLNKMEKTKKYRLPKEAEWEYACRARTKKAYHTGDCISTEEANFNGNYPLEGCQKGEFRESTIAVGSFAPNPRGLYDMHGNVWEWCQDWLGDYPSSQVTNPKGPKHGSQRVIRGGSWNSLGRDLRSACRFGSAPDSRANYIGFRIAMTR
jgi:formylglycine-generating enzyme required for sulfatase activity